MDEPGTRSSGAWLREWPRGTGIKACYLTVTSLCLSQDIGTQIPNKLHCDQQKCSDGIRTWMLESNLPSWGLGGSRVRTWGCSLPEITRSLPAPPWR